MRRDRVLGALVAVLGIGMAAALVVLVHLSTAITANRAQIQRQDDVIRQLAATVAAEQQDASAQRLLVQALQRQVRDCQQDRQDCGPPLTEPPTQRNAPPVPAATTPTPGATPAPRPRPSSTPTARPSPSPTSSPSPHPSPSPVCIPHVTCLPIGII